jgi:retron-type reverse transcriptase
MDYGVVQSRHEGTPQGGPLSPLLANVLLDEVGKELERRGTVSHATPMMRTCMFAASGRGSG